MADDRKEVAAAILTQIYYAHTPKDRLAEVEYDGLMGCYAEVLGRMPEALDKAQEIANRRYKEKQEKKGR